MKVYKQKDSDNEEDKDQTMVDIKLLFGKTVEVRGQLHLDLCPHRNT